MKLSCTNGMVPGDTLTEKANNLRKWGYDGMGVFIDRALWNDDLHEELLGLEEKTGITPCEFCFDGDNGNLMGITDQELRRRCKELYIEAVGVCREIGAVFEMEYQYRAQDPPPLFDIYRHMPAAEEKEFLDIYAEIAAVAEGSGAYVLLEPLNRYESPYLNCMDHNIEIMEKMKAKNIGILADVFHLSIEEKSIPAALERGGSWIRYVHLGDNNRLMPGYGNMDWKAIIGSLKKIGYSGYMSLECALSGDPRATLPEAAEFLKKTIKGA